MVAACTLWGLSPLYFSELAHVPALELLAHRIVWSVAIFGAIALTLGRLGDVRRLLGGPAFPRVLLAGALITLNWLIFILAVQAGEVRQSSLAYFIFPLLMAAVGTLVFGERLGRLRAGALALGALAVLLLVWHEGRLPWIALTLAACFGAYGLVKKSLAAPADASVTAEALCALPLALVWLALVQAGLVGALPAFGAGGLTTALLIGSGLLTAGPLMLFTHAARRLSLVTVGLTQYLNPLLQFLVAVVLLREPFGPAQAAAFALIWLALALNGLAALRGRPHRDGAGAPP